jgi:hypothetical protein
MCSRRLTTFGRCPTIASLRSVANELAIVGVLLGGVAALSAVQSSGSPLFVKVGELTTTDGSSDLGPALALSVDTAVATREKRRARRFSFTCRREEAGP